MPAGAPSFAEALRMGAEVFHALKGTLKERGLGTTVGDEGGFAPDLESNEAALEVLVDGIEAAGYEPGEDVFIALDPATSELYATTAPTSSSTRAGRCRAEELAAYWAGICDRYPVVSIEDGMDEEDWDGWKRAHRAARRRLPARRRRPLRHQPRAPAARDRGGRRQLDPGQGEPDRHADRDARGDRDRPRRRLHGGHLASLRRDRGHDDRRPRGRRPAPARSRPARRRARTGWPSTTSCCGSRRSSGRGPPTRDRGLCTEGRAASGAEPMRRERSRVPA